MYNFKCCNCKQCKWLRDNYDIHKWYKIDKKSRKKMFAKKKNMLRRWMHRKRIKRLRTRDPLKDEYPKENVGSYSD